MLYSCWLYLYSAVLSKLEKVSGCCQNTDQCMLHYLLWFLFWTWFTGSSFSFKLGSGFMDSAQNITHGKKYRILFMWLNMSFYLNSHRWFLICLVYILWLMSLLLSRVKARFMDWVNCSPVSNKFSQIKLGLLIMSKIYHFSNTPLSRTIYEIHKHHLEGDEHIY